MKEQLKFKSGLNKLVFWGLLIYHAVVVASFIIPTFLWRNVVSWYGYLLIAIDIVYLFPLLFNTYYSLKDDHLFIYQWPLTRIKIPYESIFIIDNEFPEEAKNKRTYGFQKKIIVIGYETEVLNKKEKKISTEKRYVAISPSDYDSFMIKIGGKFSNAKALAEKLEKQREKTAEKEEKKPQEKKVVEFVGTLKKRTSKQEQIKLKKEAEEKAIEEAETIVVSSSKGVSAKIKVIETDDNKK